MNHLYIIQLQVSGRNITHPPSPIIFNSKYDLKSFKQGNSSEYVELLSSLLIGMDACRNKNTNSVKFLECHIDDIGRGRYFDKAHTANSIKGILKTKTDTVLEVFIESDDLTYLINEPVSITQHHFDAIASIIPNVDKTALFGEVIDNVLNEDEIPKPNAIELAKRVSDKTLLNAESKYLCPIYVNEYGQMIILGEVALTKMPCGKIRADNHYGEILLENSNALPISFNHAGKKIIERYFVENNETNIDAKQAIFNSIYPSHLATEILNELTDIEVEALIKFWKLENMDQLTKYVRQIGITRVYEQIRIGLVYTLLDDQHRWLVVKLMSNINKYFDEQNDSFNYELLPLSTFIN